MRKQVDGPFRAYVGLVPTGYLSPESIAQTIFDGILYVGATKKLERLPRPKVLVKPDVAIADSKLGRYAYTHPEIVRATLETVFRFAPSAQAKIIEKSLSPFPTRRMFQRAHGESDSFYHRGYFDLETRYPGKVTLVSAEEAEQAHYQLSKDGLITAAEQRQLIQFGHAGLKTRASLVHRSTNQITTAVDYAESDFKIYCPKFKTSIQSQGLSGALRLGAPHDTRGRFFDHFVADMLEVSNPNLIVTDGIVAACGGSQTGQKGAELGLILIANNAVVHDLVMAQILNLDPENIDHLRIAIERGWGPRNLQAVEIGGAGILGVKALAEKTTTWDLGLIPTQNLPQTFETRVESLCDGKHFPAELLVGDPIESAGSHGVLMDWLYLNLDVPVARENLVDWPRVSIAVGEFREYPSFETVFAIGDAAIQTLRQLTSSSQKVFSIRGVRVLTAQLKNTRRHWVIEIPGDPPRQQDLFLGFTIGSFGRMTAPLFRLSLLVDAIVYKIKSVWREAVGKSRFTHRIMTSRLSQNRWWALSPAPASLEQVPTHKTP